MSKEQHRFLFFKYVPERKKAKPEKEVVPEQVDEKLPVEGSSEEAEQESIGLPGGTNSPMTPVEGHLENPEGPDEDYPEEPECPDEDYPEEPECPDEDYPEEPESPDQDYPEVPEYPELPEEPECPEPEPEPEPEPCPENSIIHVVKRGDTYWKLAKKYNTTVEAIEAANPGVNPLNLQIGYNLCIPIGVPGAKG